MQTESRMIIGQHFPGNSWLHQAHPLLKVLLLFVHCLFFFQLQSLSAVASGCGLLALFFPLCGLPIRVLLVGLMPLIFLLSITFGIHALTTEGTLLLGTSSFGVTIEGLHKGAFHLLRILAVILGSSLLTASTASASITYALDCLFRPLKRLGFPAAEFALMLSISLRFVPVLLEELEKLKTAQSSRGAHFSSGSLHQRFQAWLSLFVPLFHNALKRADQLALAMEIRGFDPDRPRTSYREHSTSKADVFVVGAFALLVLLLNSIP